MEIIAAVIGGTAVVFGAGLTTVGVVVSKFIGHKVDRVYEEVTPNEGNSAHDELMRAIRAERGEAIAEHEQRLHPGAQQ